MPARRGRMCVAGDVHRASPRPVLSPTAGLESSSRDDPPGVHRTALALACRLALFHRVCLAV
jgi:hypothetical protein